MANNAVILPQPHVNEDAIRSSAALQKYLWSAVSVLVLLFAAYIAFLWLFPSFGSATGASRVAHSGSMASKKAIAQLPSQVISHPVLDEVEGLTVDENSDTMRSIAELNYRHAMEEELFKIDELLGSRKSIRPSSLQHSVDAERMDF